MKKFFQSVVLCGVAVVGYASSAMAAFTLPDLPTTDLETAGTAVAALVAVAVVIGMVIRQIKKA